MTVPGNLSSPLLATAAGGAAAAAGPIKSVRFNDDDSAYLDRTPSSASNRKKWTWSSWVKKCKNGATQCLFYGGTSNNNLTRIIHGPDSLELQHFDNGSFTGRLETNANYTDPSAWYHFVVAVDTTQGTASNRIKLYVNGVLQDSFLAANYPSQNLDLHINNTNKHSIAVEDAPGGAKSYYFDGYMADVYHIDGQQLDCTSFGAFDSNGVWQAAAYSGTFGTNGFHLFDFANESGIGNDSSGNDNDFTARNIQDGVTGTATAELLCCASTSSNTATVANTGNSVSANGTVTAGSYTISSNSTGANDFNGSNGYLKVNASTSYAPSASGQPWTAEAFVNFDSFSAYPSVLEWNQSGTNKYFVALQHNGATFYCNASGTGADFGCNGSHTASTGVWYHMVAVCDGSRISTYINGTRIATTTYSGNLNVIKDYDTYIGAFGFNGGVQDFVDGKISNLRWTLAANYDPSQTSISVPAVPLSSSISGAIVGGPENNDVLFDVPTNGSQSDTGAGGEVSGNYCTFNPLKKSAGATLSNGNLQAAIGSTGGTQQTYANFGMSSGKWFWEVQSTSGNARFWGIAKDTAGLNVAPGENASSYGWGDFHGTTGEKWHNGSDSAYGTYPSLNDIVGVAFDADNGTLTFYKNGVSQGVAFTGISGTYFPVVGIDNTTHILNAGQRAFAHSAPSGYKALCTTNLPTPTIADGSAHFESKLYTGNGSTNALTMSNSSMSPDIVWIHERSTTGDYELFDSVRGANKVVETNSKNPQSTVANTLTSFDSNGFTLGSSSLVNDNNVTYVGWSWDSGSSNASNTTGSINSTCRTNIAAGISIVTYTGSGSAATVGHSLGVAPEFIVIKNLDASKNHIVYHAHMHSSPAEKAMNLNETTEIYDSAGTFNDTAPTSTVFSVGTGAATNASGEGHRALCFAPVSGFSAMGKYDGTGNSDTGAFNYTGMRPAWVMIKRITNQESWVIYDTSRNTHNPTVSRLYADLSNAESDNTGHYIDILSNGFRVRSGGGLLGASGNEYLYVAFAEHPFQANGGLAR